MRRPRHRAVCWSTAFVAAIASPALAQEAPAQALLSAERVAAERARRTLCARPLAEGAATALRTALADPALAPAARARVASVLDAHGALPDTVRQAWLDDADDALFALALPAASTEELRARLRGSAPARRRAVLFALQDRGALRDASLMAALADDDEDVAGAALSVLVHERSPLPVELADVDAVARDRLLEALAAQPRPSAVGWVRRLLAGDRLAPEQRLWAIAVLPDGGVDDALAAELVAQCADRALAGAVAQAARRLAPETADRLVGRVHAAIAGGAPVDRALACLERCSPLGERQVLALSEVLDADAVEAVCSWLHRRESVGLRERVASALDGEVPLRLHLLRRARKALTTPVRIERVAAELSDETRPAGAFAATVDGTPEERAALAFAALTAAGVYHPAMPAYVDGVAGRQRQSRVRAVLRIPPQRLPLEWWTALWRGPIGDGAALVQRAASRRGYPAGASAVLLADCTEPGRGAAACAALAAFGADEEVEAAWRRAPAHRLTMLDTLIERPRPTAAAVLARLPIDVADRKRRAAWLRTRAALGDRDAFAALLDELVTWPPRAVRRCRSFAPGMLTIDHRARLEEMLWGGDAADALRRELAEWLDSARLEWADALLVRLHAGDPDAEVRAVALAGVLRGPGAADIHTRLRRSFAAPLEGDALERVYEFVAASPPADAATVETLARLLLEAPLAVTDAELEAALSGIEPGRATYPMHRTVVDFLRREDAFDAAPFVAVAAEVATDPRSVWLNVRRLGHLLEQLAPAPRLRAALAPAVAEFLLHVPQSEPQLDGAAAWLLGESAGQRGDFAVAADLAARGARVLLRQPLPPPIQRLVLGDGDTAGIEVRAAALPWLWRARHHAATGDPAAARADLAIAEDLACGEPQTTLEIRALTEELEP